MVDVKKAKDEAIAEVKKEQEEAAKKKIKAKLQELENAKKVVKNLERELEDLEDALSQD